MSSSDFTIGQFDTASPWRLKLRGEPDAANPDGVPVDIAGRPVQFTITPIGGGAPIVDHAGNNLQVGDGISDGSRGDVSYGEASNPWQQSGTDPDGETGKPGLYLARVTVTFPGGPESFPNNGYLLMTVDPVAATTVGRYLTRDALKNTLELTGQTFADADLDIAIAATSRGMEHRWGTVWKKGSAGEVRYYTATDGRVLVLGDVLDVSEVALDYAYGDCWGDGFASSASGGAGSYATLLALTDYRLLPFQNGATTRTPPGNGEPFRELQMARTAVWPRLPGGVDGVRITGTFGWETVPAGVTAAASIIATRLLKRTREAPFGIHGIGLDQAVVRAVQLSYDPEVTLALEGVTAPRTLLV